MKNFFKVCFFSLLVIGLFAGFANLGVPRIEPAPPPTEEKLDLGALTMDQFIAVGERVYKGKGTCTLCHNNLGRAPLLEKAAGVAEARMKDPKYKGEADSIESYLIESMLKPSVYVVAGFGKKGSNDAVSPMPDVSGGSIGMNEVEIAAVTAYIQDLGGAEVTVEIPSDVGEAADDEEEEQQRKPYETIEDIISEVGCGACHKIVEEEGENGPDLTDIGAERSAAEIRKSILDPNAEISDGFEADIMPQDYGVQLYAQELEILVEYLAKSK